MCQEIIVDGQEIVRADNTCWCPLSSGYGAEGAAAEADSIETEQAFTEFGKLVWQALVKDKHPGADKWIAEVILKRW